MPWSFKYLINPKDQLLAPSCTMIGSSSDRCGPQRRHTWHVVNWLLAWLVRLLPLRGRSVRTPAGAHAADWHPGGMDQNNPAAKLLLFRLAQALRELGWTEDHNIRLDIRWGQETLIVCRILRESWLGWDPT